MTAAGRGTVVVEPATGVDAIVEHPVGSGFELDDPEALTAKIEATTTAFLVEVERFLEAHDPRPGCPTSAV